MPVAADFGIANDERLECAARSALFLLATYRECRPVP